MKKKKTIIFLSIIILITIFFMFKLDVFLVKKDFGTIYYTGIGSGQDGNLKHYKLFLKPKEEASIFADGPIIKKDDLYYIDRRGEISFIRDQKMLDYSRKGSRGVFKEVVGISRDKKIAIIYHHEELKGEISSALNELLVYDLINSKIIHSLPLDPATFFPQISLYDDNQFFIYNDAGIIYKFNLQTGEKFKLIEANMALLAPDNKLLAILEGEMGAGRTITITDIANSQSLQSFKFGRNIWQLFWTDDSKNLIITSSSGPKKVNMDIYVYSLEKGKIHKVIDNPFWKTIVPKGRIYKHES